MDDRHLEVNKFFTTNGKDIWKLTSFFSMPSCTMKNLEDGSEKMFGMGGLTAQTFIPIDMPIKNGVE